jgi:hypothetical protein
MSLGGQWKCQISERGLERGSGSGTLTRQAAESGTDELSALPVKQHAGISEKDELRLPHVSVS